MFRESGFSLYKLYLSFPVAHLTLCSADGRPPAGLTAACGFAAHKVNFQFGKYSGVYIGRTMDPPALQLIHPWCPRHPGSPAGWGIQTLQTLELTTHFYWYQHCRPFFPLPLPFIPLYWIDLRRDRVLPWWCTGTGGRWRPSRWWSRCAMAAGPRTCLNGDPRIRRMINESMNQWINESMNQWINESMNETTNQSINNQRTNKRAYRRYSNQSWRQGATQCSVMLENSQFLTLEKTFLELGMDLLLSEVF
jgi:hypothetical protein